MSLTPDPVEVACDVLTRVLAENPANAIETLAQLIADLPEARRFSGSIRLISLHMTTMYDAHGWIDPSVYAAFDPDVVHQTACEAIADAQPQEGTRLPLFGPERQRFQLVRLIAVGAFGSVWEASDSTQGTPVAIKTPWASDIAVRPWDQRVDLLAQETAVLARLHHPHIVRHIETLPDAGGVVYLVTELLAGTLASQSKPVDLPLAVRWAAQVAEATDYLRTQAVVHRDLSLGNVGLDAQGHAKIFDFGLAVAVERRTDHEGQRAGTPGHMPPEQLFGIGGDLGCRTDAAAIGVMLYELIAGESPFADPSTEATAVDWMSQKLQERTDSQNVPEVLRPILRRCFEYHQEHRYPTAGLLAQELRRLSIFSPLQAWWSGQSAATAAVYIANTSNAMQTLRQLPAAKLTSNAIAMALFQGVGVIEEFDRLARHVSDLAISLPAVPNLLDPRRQLRKPVSPKDLAQIDAELAKLCQTCQDRIDLVRQVAEGSPAPAADLFHLAQLVHSASTQAHYPSEIDRLTRQVNFPDALAAALQDAWENRHQSPKLLPSAIAAYDAQAERTPS